MLLFVVHELALERSGSLTPEMSLEFESTKFDIVS